jgi:hypothetical protein
VYQVPFVDTFKKFHIPSKNTNILATVILDRNNNEEEQKKQQDKKKSVVAGIRRTELDLLSIHVKHINGGDPLEFSTNHKEFTSQPPLLMVTEIHHGKLITNTVTSKPQLNNHCSLISGIWSVNNKIKTVMVHPDDEAASTNKVAIIGAETVYIINSPFDGYETKKFPVSAGTKCWVKDPNHRGDSDAAAPVRSSNWLLGQVIKLDYVVSSKIISCSTTNIKSPPFVGHVLAHIKLQEPIGITDFSSPMEKIPTVDSQYCIHDITNGEQVIFDDYHNSSSNLSAVTPVKNNKGNCIHNTILDVKNSNWNLLLTRQIGKLSRLLQLEKSKLAYYQEMYVELKVKEDETFKDKLKNIQLIQVNIIKNIAEYQKAIHFAEESHLLKKIDYSLGS